MKSVIAAVLLLTALVGCKGANSEANLVGKWKGEVKSQTTDSAAKFGEAMMNMASFDLELKENHEFTFLLAIIPISGTWSVNGYVVTLTPNKVFGLDTNELKKKTAENNPGALGQTTEMEKPIRLQIQPDGQTLKALDGPATGSPGELIFTKQAG
jgi:hypothetical protein